MHGKIGKRISKLQKSAKPWKLIEKRRKFLEKIEESLKQKKYKKSLRKCPYFFAEMSNNTSLQHDKTLLADDYF